MKGYKPITININSFNFCKYTMALLLWMSLLFHSKYILYCVFLLLLFSALLKVKKAPLVFFYSNTIEKISPSKEVVIDENGVLFAHVVGAVFSAAAIIILLFVNQLTGWILVGILAVLKTSGAFGMCGAMKLYDCMNNPNGKCCRVGKKFKCEK